jgi:hypothetical protein
MNTEYRKNAAGAPFRGQRRGRDAARGRCLKREYAWMRTILAAHRTSPEMNQRTFQIPADRGYEAIASITRRDLGRRK